MKLLRFGRPGNERAGALDAQGRLRDISSAAGDLHLPTLGMAGLARLRRLALADFPLVRGAPRLAVPFTGISKFVAVGLNYADHAAESGLPVPGEPVVFMKATPPGVSLGMKPPTYLRAGQVMTLGIEGLGQQRQAVVQTP